ncbi:MAG: nuclear transport factor 2 family protein [Candidatus Thorarchaeota archaeon]|jgi:ketosteroid isomerase-like protein
MTQTQDENRIKEVAMELDNAIESRDIDQIVSFFSDDCEIELMGINLSGKDGARRWLEWLFDTLVEVKFKPVIIMVEGDVFFEEFILVGTLPNGKVVESKQSEVLVYENYKIKSLRVYFDRLDFADVVAEGFISKKIVRMLISRSLKGLI